MIGNYLRLSPARLADLRANPAAVMDLLYPENGDRPPGHLDIDKAWHAIHFLLNSQTWDGAPPLVNAVLGGTPLGDLDVGYGPARFLLPQEVEALAGAVSSISAADLLGRFDPTVFNEAQIYPHGWEGAPHERDYIASRYRDLVEFVQQAAASGDALLLYLN